MQKWEAHPQATRRPLEHLESFVIRAANTRSKPLLQLSTSACNFPALAPSAPPYQSGPPLEAMQTAGQCGRVVALTALATLLLMASVGECTNWASVGKRYLMASVLGRQHRARLLACVMSLDRAAASAAIWRACNSLLRLHHVATTAIMQLPAFPTPNVLPALKPSKDMHCNDPFSAP